MSTNSNLIVRAAAEIISLFLGAIAVIYLSRIVGPEYLGFIAATIAILLFLSRLADGGLTALAMQQLAREDEKLDVLLAITIPLKLASSIVLVGLSLLTINLITIDSRLYYFITISIFTVFFETCAPTWVFIALGKITIASIIRIGQGVLYTVAIFIFIQNTDDWRYLPHLTLLNAFLNFGIATYFLFYCKLWSFDTSLFTKGYFHRIFVFYAQAFHFLKANLSTFVYMSFDRLLLYYFTTAHTVGIYEAAYKIIQPFYAISEVVTPTMFRELAQSIKQGTLYAVFARYVVAMSLFTIPLGFFLLFFSEFVIIFLYGTAFAESVPCLMILGFVITFGFTSGIIVLPFSAWNMPREYGNSVFSGNILNIILNTLLIPIAGAVGSALAALAAKVMVTITGYMYFKRATDYPVLKDFAYFFIASFIPLIAIYGLSLIITNVVVLMIVYGTVYIGIVMFVYKTYFKNHKLHGAAFTDSLRAVIERNGRT
ncbi:MAG: oligosaccharide flippase family protein [Nitrospirota bacterium]